MCPSSGELIVSIRHLVYCMSLCIDDRLVCRFGWDCSPSKPAHQMVVYTEWHIPDVVLIQFSWWWAHGCPKHVENRNKHTWKRPVRQAGYVQTMYREARSTEHKILTGCLIFSCDETQSIREVHLTPVIFGANVFQWTRTNTCDLQACDSYTQTTNSLSVFSCITMVIANNESQ
jgi:hypothetical protein